MIRKCPACGAKNRIPTTHLADRGRCGSCQAALEPIAAPIEVTSSAQFSDIATHARVPLLVDFWAEWCGPCRMAAPLVKRVAAAMAGRALVLKVNTERLPDLAQRYDVRGIPNFLVLENGAITHQQAGLAQESQMVQWLAAAGARAAS